MKSSGKRVSFPAWCGGFDVSASFAGRLLQHRQIQSRTSIALIPVWVG
jgi:hypothetical protein